MKVIFVGASRFGLRCLKQLLKLSDVDMVGVITNDKHFSISYAPEGITNVLYENIGQYAEKYHLPVYKMFEKMTEPELVKQVELWQPDLFVVAGWYHMVPSVLRDIAPAAGLHASLLPDYSGGSPLVWAMINGEKKTGITFFMMDDGVDSGKIIGQAEEIILEEDTIATLYSRIEERGIELITRFIPKLANGTAVLHCQDETKRRIMPQRSPKDGEIDWNWVAQRVFNFIRAQTKPYPGAFSYLNGQKITIWSAERCVNFTNEKTIGKIVNCNSEIGVVCGEGLLRLNSIGINDKEFTGADIGEIVPVGYSFTVAQ